MTVEGVSTDVLILGGGGAALTAALHVTRRRPHPRVTLAVKGMMGKSGCTRMVQGGYNAVLHPDDSLERHLADTLDGGAFLNDQELVWILVSRAPDVLMAGLAYHAANGVRLVLFDVGLDAMRRRGAFWGFLAGAAAVVVAGLARVVWR